MKSRTSCCNATLLRRTILRGLPLWGLYLLIMIIVMPGSILTSRYLDLWGARSLVLGVGAYSSHPVGFLYAIAMAMLCWQYLYKSVSANFFGALPLTRGCMFGTQYLAGLLMALVPNAIVALLTMAAGAVRGFGVAGEALQFFAAYGLSFLFYFGLASLLAMITGNLVALPILYGLVNVMAVLLEMMVQVLMENLVYGAAFYSSQPRLGFLSPVANAALFGCGPEIDTIYGEVGNEIIDLVLVGWQSLLLYAAVGLVLAALAFLLLRGRRMETAGDVIAVRPLRPVALYVFTFGCTLVLGNLFTELLFSGRLTQFAGKCFCLILGGTIGYFVGQMLLQRTARVFNKGSWLRWGVCALVIVGGLLCIRFDAFGYGSYVPQIEDIQTVVPGGYSVGTDDPALIEQTVALHQQLAENRDQLLAEKESGNTWSSIRLRYELKNGNTVEREYQICDDMQKGNLSTEVLKQYAAIYNDPDYILTRSFVKDYRMQDVQLVIFHNYETDQDLNLVDEEAYDYLKTCLEPDLVESSMTKLQFFPTEPTLERELPSNLPVSVEVIFKPEFMDTVKDHHYSYYFDLYTDSAHTLDFLEARDFPVSWRVYG